MKPMKKKYLVRMTWVVEVNAQNEAVAADHAVMHAASTVADNPLPDDLLVQEVIVATAPRPAGEQ